MCKRGIPANAPDFDDTTLRGQSGTVGFYGNKPVKWPGIALAIAAVAVVIASVSGSFG